MWLQEGKASYQSWEGGIVSGSIRGNANLKSSIQIIDSDGKKYPMLKEGTEYVMGGNPGENINIKLQTSSEGDPRSDEYGVTINKLDMDYLIKTREDYLRTLGASRKKYLLEHEDELNAILENQVDMNQVLVGVYSITGESDENGLAEINIPIQPGWKNSLLFTNVHYGYADYASDDAQKKLDWWSEAGPLVLQTLVWIAAGVFSGGGAFVLGAVRLLTIANKIVLIPELTYMTRRYLQDGYGSVGMNKYDAKFPNPGGFNHTYTIDTTGLSPRTAVDKFLTGPLFYPVVIGALAITVFG